MRKVITAGDVEAAGAGKAIVVDAETTVTPLARDRALALGVRLDTIAAADRSHRHETDLPRLVLESKVRMVTRRVLLRAGTSPGRMEEVVAAVLRRLEGGCDCGCQ